ncbi:HNH endonuclease [Streptomyces sp. NPDC007117]|uniref:HNH endonuclease n=1 Tax=Streptomyces sp. NPDC007117 TaxID=3154314 RepID=UPI0033E25BF4
MSRTNAKTPARRRVLLQAVASRPGCGWWCFYCRTLFTPDIPPTFDHYIPYSMWRTGWHRNLVLACAPCNTAKADALPWAVAYLLLNQAKAALTAYVYPPGDYAGFDQNGSPS